jgi:starch synthase (maltosyl-transferring)
LRFSAPRIILTLKNTRSGFASGLMAPCNMPKTRPKKYQDIYPFDFESDDWEALWEELRSVIQFWIDQGIRIFRVDNPHTKTVSVLGMAHWRDKKDYPDTVFLSEAFTRPKDYVSTGQTGFYPIL